MKDNEYYCPSDTKKSISDEKKTLINQETTIAKKRLIPKLNKKKKAKQGALNQSAALVMSSVAVLMVSLDAFPLSNSPNTSFIGSWEDGQSMAMHLDIDEEYNITLYSRIVDGEITVAASEVTSDKIVAVLSYEEEYAEVLVNFVNSYSGTVQDYGNNYIQIEKEGDFLIFNLSSIPHRDLLFIKSSYRPVDESIIGYRWVDYQGRVLLIQNSGSILYYDGENDGIILTSDGENYDHDIYKHTEVYDVDADTGHMTRNEAHDHYLIGDYISEDEMIATHIHLGETVFQDEVFTKESEIRKEDWDEVYNIIWTE